MGAVCGGQKVQATNLSISGKPVQSCNKFIIRFLAQKQEGIQVYKVADSLLYLALNREITKKLKFLSEENKNIKQNREGNESNDMIIAKNNEEFEFIDVRTRGDYIKSNFFTSMHLDPEQDQEFMKQQSTLKLIFNFKTVFFIHDQKNNFDVKEIPEKVKKILTVFEQQGIRITQAYILLENYNDIAQKYKYFVNENGSKLQQAKQFLDGKQLPILFFDNQEFHKDLTDPVKQIQRKALQQIIPSQKFQIFMHTIQKFNQIMETDQEYYMNHLNIQHIIFINNKKVFVPKIYKSQVFPLDNKSEFQSNAQKILNLLFQNLNVGQSTLILHDQSVGHSGITCINVLNIFMYEKLYIFESSINEYTRVRMSKNSAKKMGEINTTTQTTQNNKNKKQNKSKSQMIDSNKETFQDKVLIEFNNFYKESKKNIQVVEKAKNMTIGMIEKIVQSPEDLKYRTLKKSNQTVQQTVLNYKSGKNLLQMIGFQENGEIYTNQMEYKFIKLLKVDIDLAYSQFKAKI
ncbi:hypothetical protein PPERSA_01618 [Pseudocohnilembus persalinus]|uniref:PUB domain-containing protein n=1 Tax=Pseudocohnilembus persalinus TaxID=266149 RepID=A0A0V0QHT0_PSEPJ|nr:hypothetical protein PPERSA_01618 [Pseudocohnilembus persalinus]|eukprot:KRX01748.1 hypothetical protein PPERSA_01618 [Pseudocohnilembus persalinus]